jgi:hypothetical protein
MSDIKEFEKPKEKFHLAIHLLRTVHQHHSELSVMADNKAGVLLAASIVSFSILSGWLGSGKFGWAIVFVSITTLLTAFFAALSLLPRFAKCRDVHAIRNPLFFGEFATMTYQEFEKTLLDTLSDEEESYKAMILDIYALGCVLQQKKYRYLRYSYISFLSGIITASCAAGIEVVLGFL